ncbi:MULTISPECIES: TetR/AcrR family transcriptional regulator [Thermomonosporaceae]|uniref:TetR/AcrR family transcriptional regulator n=1 Tax=Thermomonosporaceae TaxID=2012 RepID=UPI00255B1831|nr:MULTISPECIES: TetR/AcrR family transcriptional regulator [Thermomonosporaceae]MDL4772166.1 TetR/AcrR family transcriptional regulator [Actinomadura xylanilytica]
MARPRTFDEERAVDAAMRAFWASGYEATSTQDLCEATGLGRSSIYNTFKSKHDLYEMALAHYMDIMTASVLEVLEGDRPARDKVRTLLDRAVDPTEGDPIGCLVVNSMVEMAPSDPAIAGRLERDRLRRFEALRAAIGAGVRAGEIDPGRDAGALAHFMIATIAGMRVASRGGAGRDVLKAIADTAMTAL